MMLVDTRVGPSSIDGLGVIATWDIPNGTKIWEFHEGFDRVFSEAQLAALPPWQSEFFKKYCFKFNGSFYYCIDNARFMNHSDNPNAVDRPDGTYAVRDITAGEEISCNYAVMGATMEDTACNVACLG